MEIEIKEKEKPRSNTISFHDLEEGQMFFFGETGYTIHKQFCVKMLGNDYLYITQGGQLIINVLTVYNSSIFVTPVNAKIIISERT